MDNNTTTTETQAIHAFMNSFGIPGYVEGSVPDDATLPYLTYIKQVGSSQIDIWENTQSELTIDNLTRTVVNSIRNGGRIISYTGGCVYITTQDPVWRKGPTDDPKEKHTIINIYIEELDGRF